MNLSFDKSKDAKTSKSAVRVLVTVLPVLIPIIVFFAFNMLTPFWWDDFVMGCFFVTWSGHPHDVLLSSFSDVVISTYNMYQTHHGRIVVDFINFLFMFLKDKNIFNVCNTIVYCILVLMIGFHVTGSLKKISGLLFMVINILLWLVVPAWGQCLLWLTGSCNYLWTSTIILLFLIPFRKKIEDLSYKPHIVVSLLWIVPGILAGWSMENYASSVFILLLVYFVLKRRKKEPVMVFEILGSIGFMVGFFMLINARRHSLLPEGFWGLIKNAVKIGSSFIFQDGLLLGVIILLAIELIYFRKMPIAKIIYSFFLAALASVAALIIPRYRDFIDGRPIFITQIFFIIILLSLVIQIKKIISKRYVVAAVIMLMLVFIPSFYTGIKDIVKGFVITQAREHYILSEKEKGNLAIKVKTPITVYDLHNGMYEGLDIVNNPADLEHIIQNRAKVTWYGIESLDGIPASEETGIKESIKEFLNRRKTEKLSIDDLFTMIYEGWK